MFHVCFSQQANSSTVHSRQQYYMEPPSTDRTVIDMLRTNTLILTTTSGPPSSSYFNGIQVRGIMRSARSGNRDELYNVTPLDLYQEFNEHYVRNAWIALFKNTNPKLKPKISKLTWYESTPWDEVFINNELSILPSSVGRKSTLNEIFPIAGITYRDHKEACLLSAVNHNTHHSPTDTSTCTSVSTDPTSKNSALRSFTCP